MPAARSPCTSCPAAPLLNAYCCCPASWFFLGTLLVVTRMLVTVAGALAAPSFTSRIADRYIAPTDEAVQTRVYVLAGGSNMDGRANAAELTSVNLARIQNASMRVQLVYVGGFDPTRVKSPASRYEGPLATVSPNKMLKHKLVKWIV